MMVGGVPWRSVVRHTSVGEILFFACLFVMVGAVDAAGVLAGPSAAEVDLWRANPIEGALLGPASVVTIVADGA